MNWKVNEIVRVDVSIGGRPIPYSMTFRIVEIANDRVLATPAMEEKLQARAATFIKRTSDATIDDAIFEFDAITGDQVVFTDFNKALRMKFKINKIAF